VVGVSLSSSIAQGAMSASLEYDTDPLLPSCPSAAEFRRSIVRHLRYDPFGANPAHHIIVRIHATGERMEGRVEWRDANDQWEGERTFSSKHESCLEMGRAMALTTAFQLELLVVASRGAPAPSAEAPLDQPVEAPPPVAAIVQATPPTPPLQPSEDPRLAIEVGAGLIRDAGESPTFAVPRLVVLVGRPSTMGLRLAVSGLGPSRQVTESGGTARIDRLLVTLELIHFFRPGRRLQPLLAAGAGMQDMRVTGISAMPSLAADHAGQSVSGVFLAGAGVAFALANRLALVVEVDALLFRPSLTVQIASTTAAHLDGAAVFAHGGVLARF
jgi:hypothetical protein